VSGHPFRYEFGQPTRDNANSYESDDIVVAAQTDRDELGLTRRRLLRLVRFTRTVQIRNGENREVAQ
jgi:hypothetical protein